jgi:PAS domain S-box-containing protein
VRGLPHEKIHVISSGRFAEALTRDLAQSLGVPVERAGDLGAAMTVAVADLRGTKDLAAAVRALRAVNSDAVLIVVTDTPDDRRDAAAIVEGADDCIALSTAGVPGIARALRFAGARRAERDRLATIHANLPGLVFRRILNSEGKISYAYVNVSRRLKDSAYFTSEDFDVMLSRTHPEDREPMRAAILRSAREMSPYDFTRRVVDPQGSVRWMRSIATPRRETDGSIIWDGISIEVTAQKLAEERLAAVVANLPGDVFRRILHPDGRIEFDYVNPNARELYGLDASRIRDDSLIWINTIHPTDREVWWSQLRESAKSGSRFDVEFRVLVPGRGYKWMRSIASPHKDPDGSVVWDGISIDVTDQKLAEEQLGAVVANLPGNVYRRILHPDGRFEFDYVSARVRRRFGIEPRRGETEGVMFIDMIHPEDLPAWRAAVQESARSGKRFDHEFRTGRPGDYRWVRSTAAAATRGPHGEMIWDGITVDIDEMKRADEARREFEERLRRLAANFPGAIFQFERTADGQPSYPYLSPGVRGLVGFEAEEIQRAPSLFTLSIMEEDRTSYAAAFDDSAGAMRPGSWEGRIRSKFGEVKWIEASFQPYAMADGGIRWDGVIVDVTERKRAQERLGERERHLKAVAEHFPGVLYQRVLHADGSVTYPYVSAGVKTMYGYEPEEILRNPALFPAGILDEDRQAYRAELDRSARTLTPRIWEGRERKKSGEVMWIQVYGQPRKLSNGDIIWDSIILDVTEKRRTERRLEENEIRLRAIAENTPGNVFRRIQHPDKSVTYPHVSWGMLRSLGLDTGEFTDPSRYLAMFHPDDTAELQAVYDHSARTLAPIDKEYRFILPSGEIRWVRTISAPTKLADGSVAWDGISLDVTDTKRVQQATEDAREAAEAANLAKSQFLATVSHELRTPLNAIMGFSEVMRDQLHGPLSPEYEEFSRLIHESGQQLLELISGILDMSRIESGSYDLKPEHADMAEIAASAFAAVARRAQEKSVQARNRVKGPLLVERVDPGAARQVLQGLLSNAVKFTEPGGIVTLEGAGTPDWVEITVADTGIGIPEDALERIFEPFHQVDASFTRRHEGAGLGLSIGRRLMEMHGGTIAVASKTGEGTRVTVRFPRK